MDTDSSILADLDPTTLEMASLYYADGYTYQAIGDFFGMTRQSVHGRLSHFRDHLRSKGIPIPPRPASRRPSKIYSIESQKISYLRIRERF